MSRFDEKVAYDVRKEKTAEYVEMRRMARRDYCEKECQEHNENCPYYDAEQEEWDYEQCFEDGGEVDLRE